MVRRKAIYVHNYWLSSRRLLDDVVDVVEFLHNPESSDVAAFPLSTHSFAAARNVVPY